jgi:hypothetical protein
VHDAPEVDVHQPPVVVERHLVEPAVDRRRGVVDPRVEPAERAHGGARHLVDVAVLRHVARHGDHPQVVVPGGARRVEHVPPGLAQRRPVARREHQAADAALGGQARGGEADPTRPPRQDEDLLAQRREACGHGVAGIGMGARAPGSSQRPRRAARRLHP